MTQQMRHEHKSVDYLLRMRKYLVLSTISLTIILASMSSEASAANPPNPPGGFTATAVSSTQINLSWTSPNNGGSPITGYKIMYVVDNGEFKDLVSNTATTTTNYSHKNLIEDHIYFYQVYALNSVGQSDSSDIVTSTTLQGNTVPSPPTSLAANPASPTSIFLSWNSPQSNGGSAITGYKIEYSTVIDQWRVIVSNTGIPQQSFYHTGIDSGKNYDYRVSAINSKGVGSPSTTASSIPQITTAPTITGIAVSPTQVRLSWVAPSYTYGERIIGYKIEQKVGDTYDHIVENTGAVTSYIISGLTTGKTYSFHIAALFSGGTQSIPSVDFLVTPTTASYSPSLQQSNLPNGASVYTSQQSPGPLYSVAFSNSGPQTQYFTIPNIQVNGIWATVSTYVSGAVLYFDSNGRTYSMDIYPNSHTWISFSNPMSVSNVRMSIDDRVYSSDVGSISYVGSDDTPRSQSVPNAPRTLYASLNSKDTVELSWTVPLSGGKPPVSGYKIEYKADPSNSWSILSRNIGLPTIYVQSGLSASHTYTFRVSAINSIGTGEASNEASVTTGSFTIPTPTGLQISSGMIPVLNTDTSLSYVITGGQVYGTSVNKDANSLDFQLQGHTAGVLYLQLPRTLIDAKQSDQSDRTFYVTVDNKNVDFTESKTSDYRTLAISFPANADNLSIIGTSVVPEFGTIAALVLAVAIISIIAVSAKTKIRLIPKY